MAKTLKAGGGMHVLVMLCDTLQMWAGARGVGNESAHVGSPRAIRKTWNDVMKWGLGKRWGGEKDLRKPLANRALSGAVVRSLDLLRR